MILIQNDLYKEIKKINKLSKFYINERSMTENSHEIKL